MTDKDSPDGGPSPRNIPGFQKAFEFDHLPERLHGDLRISRVSHTHFRKFRFRKFEIRKKNIHLPGIVFHLFRFLISGTVENPGDFDPFFPQGAAKRQDMRPKMVRRHKIQVVDPFEKKHLYFGEKFRGRDRAAVMLDRDLIVLAEKTLAGAAAEEYCAGTPGPREGGLFPEMGTDERNAASRALAAETQRIFRAIDLTIART
jgi:hypothetical protein